jgi:hypothetical protein
MPLVVISKPNETAKQFIVWLVDGNGHVAGIKASNNEVKAVMRKVAAT